MGPMEVGNSNQRHRLPGGFFLLISEEQKKAAPFVAAINYIEVRGSEKVEIVKKTSTVHTSRYANRPLQYLVIHYTAGGTSRKGTARNVASMFGNPANRDASADFIVDDAECVQFNGDIRNRYTYAVGGGLQGNPGGGKFYGKCKNFNSISIEICSSSTNNDLRYPNTKNWYFTDAARNNAVELAPYLMDTYNIPDDHLIRHYDVNQKLCPGIIGWNKESGSEAKWIAFRDRVLNGDVVVDVNYCVRVTASDGLNCRTSPVNGSVVMTYPKDAILTITKETNGWGYTGAGWVSLAYTEKEEDEDMTQDRFNEMFDAAMSNYLKKLQDNDAGDWSKADREWGISEGLFNGSGTTASGEPNYMWHMWATREQLAALFHRFKQGLD